MIKKIIFALLAASLAVTGCDKKNHSFDGENQLILKFEDGNSNISLLPFSKQEVTLNIELTKALATDVEISLKIKSQENLSISDYLQLTPETITLKKGEKKGAFKISAVDRQYPQEMTLFVIAVCSDPEVKIRPIEITIKPDKITELTEHDNKLINSWKSKYNIDVRPLIGKWLCEGEIITYYGRGTDNDYTIDRPNAPIKLANQITGITVSPLASEDRIILAMPYNAFGLSSYYRNLYRFYTLDNDVYWYYPENPALPSLQSKIGIGKDVRETYDVSFYSLEIDPKTKNIKIPFLKHIKDILKLPGVDKLNDVVLNEEGKCDDDKQLIIYLSEDEPDVLFLPLVFNFSIWEKCLNYIKTHPEDVQMKETLKTCSISPYQILYKSAANIDQWEGETDNVSNFVEPSLTLENNNVIKLIVSTDGNGNVPDCGYSNFKITMTKIK